MYYRHREIYSVTASLGMRYFRPMRILRICPVRTRQYAVFLPIESSGIKSSTQSKRAAFSFCKILSNVITASLDDQRLVAGSVLPFPQLQHCVYLQSAVSLHTAITREKLFQGTLPEKYQLFQVTFFDVIQLFSTPLCLLFLTTTTRNFILEKCVFLPKKRKEKCAKHLLNF